jgi:hypothetical protein
MNISERKTDAVKLTVTLVIRYAIPPNEIVTD